MTHTELDLRERRAIEDMLNAKMPVSRIATELGRHRSSVSIASSSATASSTRNCRILAATTVWSPRNLQRGVAPDAASSSGSQTFEGR